MRHISRRRTLSIGAGTAVLILVIVLLLQAYSRPLPIIAPRPTANMAGIQATPQIAWSPYGEQAITVLGHPTLSTNNGSNNPLPTASIAKVMTALAILQEKPLQLGQQGPAITIGPGQVAIYQQDMAQNQSVIAVSAGEQLTEYQALEAMLVPSATNIADIAAPWAFGSLSAYLTFANHYAAQLGMTDSHFADASGFSPQTTSTPQDLLKLAQAAMQNPVIAAIVDESSVTLPVAGTVQNFNTALGQNGIIGIKTGNTDQAGGALLYAATYQGLTVLGVALGAPDLGTATHDAPEVLDSFEQQLTHVTAVHLGQVLGSYRLPWGGTVQAIAAKDISIWEWKDSKPNVSVSLKSINVATDTKTPIGQVTVTGLMGEAPGSSAITLQRSPPQPGAWWRIYR